MSIFSDGPSDDSDTPDVPGDGCDDVPCDVPGDVSGDLPGDVSGDVSDESFWHAVKSNAINITAARVKHTIFLISISPLLIIINSKLVNMVNYVASGVNVKWHHPHCPVLRHHE